ncbi:hypothetical protein EV421DRAFT_2000746 [Armillaria borealis]|uniref:Uncharacterized protein n=1 Tax=Armillaria borealis TaxID=47425 RepID=A0AA39IYZ4_9AGAR|nr:hypothetical protein EV421DRAFT_2000746 [Armillaria borealis]
MENGEYVLYVVSSTVLPHCNLARLSGEECLEKYPFTIGGPTPSDGSSVHVAVLNSAAPHRFFYQTLPSEKWNHEDVRLAVVDEIALRNLEPVTIGLSSSSLLRGAWQTVALSWSEVAFLGFHDGQTVFAQDVTDRRVTLPGHEDFPSSFVPSLPPLANTPVVSKISDVAKYQPSSIRPAKLSSYCHGRRQGSYQQARKANISLSILLDHSPDPSRRQNTRFGISFVVEASDEHQFESVATLSVEGYSLFKRDRCLSRGESLLWTKKAQVISGYQAFNEKSLIELLRAADRRYTWLRCTCDEVIHTGKIDVQQLEDLYGYFLTCCEVPSNW